MQYQLHHGDCLAVLAEMPDSSVDSIVTDPPYELGFMGKSWDASGIAYNVDMWREALRVLKPGGHLLAFSGSRTYHRMTCAIEDAGFEVRDQIMWIYGSGFPKSLDVSKAIDKAAGVRGHDGKRFNAAGDGAASNGGSKLRSDHPDYVKPKGVTEAARQWEGWGTALKPAHEPICVARKPLQGTVAANVLEFGTGALNIDGCRVATNDDLNGGRYSDNKTGEDGNAFGSGINLRSANDYEQPAGRWPANLIHDGSEEVLAGFPVTTSGGGQRNSNKRDVLGDGFTGEDSAPRVFAANTGSAARFFYCAKASKQDRDEGLDDAPDRILAMSNQAKAQLARGILHEGNSGVNSAKVRKNNHPTVKPTELMAYLVRMVTPPGGLVLDPFMGSGSTGKAAMREGFRFVGIDMTAEYVEIARARIEHALLGDLL